MRRLLLLPVLFTAAALSACGGKEAAPAPTGPHVDLAIDAPATTHYEMLCDVSTYTDPSGQVINRYGVDKTGPFKDAIPSRSVHCTAKIDTGPGPVTVTLTKNGAIQTMTIDTVGDGGKKTLHVW